MSFIETTMADPPVSIPIVVVADLSQDSGGVVGDFATDLGLNATCAPLSSSNTVSTNSFLCVRDPPMGFFWSFGRMSGVANSEESLSYPSVFSKFVDNKDFSEGSSIIIHV